MATRYKITILLYLLVFCTGNAQATTTRLSREQPHTVLPSSSPLNSHFRPIQTSTTKPSNQLSTHVLIPRPDYWLLARTFLQTQALAVLATPPLTSLSKCTVRVKSTLAVALTIAQHTCVTAITPITTTARKLADVCKKNYRYLQAAREHERRLIQNQEDLQMTTAVEASSNETSLTIALTRQQTISAVAALAEIDPQDVLPVVLQLESAVRGVQRFTQVKAPSYVRVFNQLWQRIAPRVWVRALYARFKTGLFVSVFTVGFLGAALCAWMDDRITKLVRGVLFVTMMFLSWRYLVEEG